MPARLVAQHPTGYPAQNSYGMVFVETLEIEVSIGTIYYNLDEQPSKNGACQDA
jgi:hypothetical protein